MQEIPIYLFTGFMDSGKTTLIKETLLENGFADQGKSLIICCEDGGWMVVQSLATVDATTFDMYLANMRTMIMEQLFQADVVIFNRCDDSTDKGKYRRNVKALNRKAQLVYERADGSLDEREEELPFDISGDELEITDADYAIW